MLDLSSLQSTHGLDTAITEGKEFKLAGNDEYTFLVKVPSQHNKPFRNAIAASLDMSYGDDGEVKMNSNIVQFRQKQSEAFVSHCMVSINGEPVPADFGDKFPTVVEELMEAADKVAQAIDGEVEDAVKK